MTAYLTTAEAQNTWSGAEIPPNPTLALKAGSFEVRIARIEITRFDAGTDTNDSVLPRIYRYASGTVSGGATAPIVPLRQGAPAATATARGGTGVSVSGTSSPLTSMAAISQGGATYEFPFDCTLSPGAVLLLDLGQWYVGDPSNIYVLMTVAFEELRLAWHY